MAYVNGKKIPGSLYMGGSTRGDYDLVITSDEQFSQCLYPLFKNEEEFIKNGGDIAKNAAARVGDDSLFNTFNPDFTARRILVKDVTFKIQRGYNDVLLHIFQPSIEYIKFENCRWEAHWKVSGKNPRDPSDTERYNLNSIPGNATAFNRAKENLTLTIEGVRITEENVEAAPNNPITWGVGFRNVKLIKDCHIDYPKDYKLTSDGYRTLEMSCQFFDFADNCSISGLWDGTNISNCRVNKMIKRCVNVTNVDALNLPDYNGNPVPISIDNCTNLVNVNGLITFVSCGNKLAATREEALGYANDAKDDANDYTDIVASTRRAIETGEGLKDGEYFVYVVKKQKNANTGESECIQTHLHARNSASPNEIPIRDTNGKLTNSWADRTGNIDIDYGSTYSSVWGKGVCMPRHYIDEKFKRYVPIDTLNQKIPDMYNPVIEGYYFEELGKQYFGSHEGITDSAYTPTRGKLYVDIKTNTIYRWNGSVYRTCASPAVSSSDNGKILQVVDGAWSAVAILDAEGGSF